MRIFFYPASIFVIKITGFVARRQQSTRWRSYRFAPVILVTSSRAVQKQLASQTLPWLIGNRFKHRLSIETIYKVLAASQQRGITDLRYHLSDSSEYFCLSQLKAGLVMMRVKEEQLERITKMSKQCIVLAYSGGLDTTFCLTWLIQEKNADVVTLTVDTGGFSSQERDNMRKRSLEYGAKSHEFVDARTEMFERFVSVLIQGNILRGHVYPLSVAAERVVQAEELAKAAIRLQANAVAHGSTGAGNDQYRFEATLRTLLPSIPVLAPVRDLGWSREKEADYLAQANIHISSQTKTYSVNQGLWGTTIGGGKIHDGWEGVEEAAFPSAEGAPTQKASEITLGFEEGCPVSIDGQHQSGVELVSALNEIGRAYQLGRGVHIGETILGIKGRIAFEAPAPLLLIAAHRELEKLMLTRWQLFWKDHLADFYGNMLHEGLYYDPVMRDLEAFIRSSQKPVTGEARLQLWPKGFSVDGVRSPHSIMDTNVAVYGETTRAWNAEEAAGYGKLRSLAMSLAYNAHKRSPEE